MAGPTTTGVELLMIDEPGTGWTDQSYRLHFGDPAGSLGGNERTSYGAVMRQRMTANIALSIDASDAYMPVVGAQTFLYDVTLAAQKLVFAGTIDKIQTSWWGKNGDRLISLTCVSFEQTFDQIRVPGRLYQNVTAGFIFVDLTSLATGWPGTAGVINDGPIIDSFLIENNPTISEVYARLATIASFVWGVDISDLTLFFHLPAITIAPFTLQASDILWEAADFLEDRHDFRDRQIITGDYDAFGRSAECFAGAGQTVFTLRNPVHDVTNAWITKNTQNHADGTFTGIPLPGDSVTISYPTSGSAYNWAATSPYFIDYFIIDPSGHKQVCIASGTSGGSMPTWNDVGGVTIDGTVHWQDKGAAGFGPYSVAIYTWVFTLDNTQYGQVLIGGSIAACAQNLIDAINSNTATRGITYSLPTWENPLVDAENAVGSTFLLHAKGPGDGSKAALAATGTAFSWSAAVTSGGITTFGTESIPVGLATANTQGLGYTPGSPVVLLFHGPLNVGTTLCVEYHRLDGNQIAVENTPLVTDRALIEAGTGKYQALTSDNSATPVQLLAEAQSALRAFQIIPNWFEFMTFRQGLQITQSLPVAFKLPTGPDPRNSGVIVSAVLSVVSEYAGGSYHPFAGFQQSGGALLSTNVDHGIRTDTVALTGTQLTGFQGSLTLDALLVGTLFGSSTPSAVLKVYDTWIYVVYADATTAVLRPTTAVVGLGGGGAGVGPAGSGTVINPLNAIDGDPSTFATITRTNFDPFTDPAYLAMGSYGAATKWVIQEITGELIPSEVFAGPYGSWRYTVRCVDAAQVGDFLDFWLGLSSGGGTSDIPTFNGGPGPVTTSSESVSHNGTLVGTEPDINFIDGANVTLTVVDNGALGRVDVTIAAAASVSKYVQSFSAVSTVTVTHGLGTTDLLYQVWNSAGDQILPESAVFTNSNTITLGFGVAQTGKVVVIG